MVANNGAIEVLWVQGAGQWNGPGRISPTGLAPVGAHPVVSQQYGIPNQTDVFVIDDNEVAQVIWVQGGGQWNGPLTISPARFAPAGAHIAAAQQLGVPNQTDVFAAGNNGAIDVIWVEEAGNWNGPMPI
jgi:hypothetical protein